MSLSKKTKEAKPPRGPDVPKLPEDQLSAAVAAIQLESISTSTSVPPPQAGKDSEQKKKEEKKDIFPAILDTSQYKRLIINNGSFKSASDDDDCLTAIVLPDFTYVNEIQETKENAERLWRTTLDPSVRRAGRRLPDVETAGRNKFQTRPLPYDSVVLICECVPGFICPLRAYVACVGSHKRRDNRCGIAAPILEKGAIIPILFVKEEIYKAAFLAITAVLESRGWEVHREIEIDHSIQPLEDRLGDDDTRETELLQQIRDSEAHHDGHGASKRALLVKVSHIGGHKFAGNMIVYSPSGTGVWYGRVSPEKVSYFCSVPNATFTLRSTCRMDLPLLVYIVPSHG